MSAWLTDIRKTALVAAGGAVAASVIPARPAIQSIAATSKSAPWFTFPILGLFGLLFVTITLGFPMVLWRSHVPLRISVRLRYVALLAATINTLMILWSVFRWARFYWLRSQWPTPISATEIMLDSLGAAAYIFFLVAIFRHKDESPVSDPPVSRLLRGITKISIVVLSLVLIGIVAAAIYWTVEYPYYQGLARLYGREKSLPSLSSDLRGRARAFLLAALLWVPPFIIHRSLRVKRGVADVPAESV
jgi:hypothetical protein